MAILDDDKKLDTILELFYKRFNGINTKTLQLLGETVAKFEGLSASDAYKLRKQLELSNELDDLINEISKVSKLSEKDVYKIFEKVAKENVEFAEVFYKAKNEEYVDYENNKELQNFVKTIEKETNSLFKNISNTEMIGFNVIDPNTNKKKFIDLPHMYYDLIDEAVYNVASGQIDYQSAMRNVLRQLADSGLKINETKVAYKSGYSRRLDSVIRESILTALRQINIGIQEQVGKDFGADGVEISAHFPCAEDHLDIQGRQYSDEEFEELNQDLMRPIGELNCRHFVFSIVLGVNQPSYTNKQLEQMKKESLEKVEFEGKTYTKYEATQVQRRLETAIRQQKDRQIIAKASGDMDEVAKAQLKISQYTKKYKNFSDACGLDVYMKRTSVSGYKRTSVNVSKTVSYTKNEQAAIQRYFGGYSYGLNSKLRDSLKLNNLDELTKKNLDSALNKTSNYKGNIVRVMNVLDPDTFINQLKIDKEYSTDQYLSFSTKEGYDEKGNIRIYVENSQKSKDLTKLNKIGENETLYKRKQKFITRNIVKRNGIYYILWEEK